VFLDETGLNTQMVRRHGRAPKGTRCLDHVPHGHWRSATFLAALRHDRLTAPLLLDGPLDGEMFLAYVKECLGPTLQPGDLVICDNLSSHKVPGVRAALAGHGAELLYLPPYSPDFNPIELAFAKLKAALRAAAAREWEELLRATAAALSSFTPEHCANFFRHAQCATS
jgi:transposase